MKGNTYTITDAYPSCTWGVQLREYHDDFMNELFWLLGQQHSRTGDSV